MRMFFLAPVFCAQYRFIILQNLPFVNGFGEKGTLQRKNLPVLHRQTRGDVSIGERGSATPGAINAQDVAGQIKASGQGSVQNVRQHGSHAVRQTAKERRQEEGVTLKEHVIRVDRRKVDDIGWNRLEQQRQRRQKAGSRRPCITIAMVAGNLNQQRAKQHGAVIQQRVQTGKGKAGIMT